MLWRTPQSADSWWDNCSTSCYKMAPWLWKGWSQGECVCVCVCVCVGGWVGVLNIFMYVCGCVYRCMYRALACTMFTLKNALQTGCSYGDSRRH